MCAAYFFVYTVGFFKKIVNRKKMYRLFCSSVFLPWKRLCLSVEAVLMGNMSLLQILTAHWVSYVLGRQQCPNLSDIVVCLMTGKIIWI